MMNILTQILNGQVKPFEQIGEGSEEIKELEKLIERNGECLCETLNNNQKEILDKYNGCIEEYYGLLIEDAFCVGFSLSAKILTESLSKSEKLYMN